VAVGHKGRRCRDKVPPLWQARGRGRPGASEGCIEGRPTEALHRLEPQKSARGLRESINITWGTVPGGPVRVHKLADRTIDLFGV
jgi:hypothetical protein